MGQVPNAEPTDRTDMKERSKVKHLDRKQQEEWMWGDDDDEDEAD